jgi:hypothetical protein
MPTPHDQDIPDEYEIGEDRDYSQPASPPAPRSEQNIREEPVPRTPLVVPRQALSETSKIPKPTFECGIGIVGPTNSGKTYLFQGLVHRLENPGRYGVMTRYLKSNGVSLWESSKPPNRSPGAENLGHSWILRDFNARYKHWEELPATPPNKGYWYHLLLSVVTGWRGQRESTFMVNFIDCAGEEYQRPLDLTDARRSNPKLNTTVWMTFGL